MLQRSARRWLVLLEDVVAEEVKVHTGHDVVRAAVGHPFPPNVSAHEIFGRSGDTKNVMKAYLISDAR